MKNKLFFLNFFVPIFLNASLPEEVKEKIRQSVVDMHNKDMEYCKRANIKLHNGIPILSETDFCQCMIYLKSFKETSTTYSIKLCEDKKNYFKSGKTFEEFSYYEAWLKEYLALLTEVYGKR